MQRPLMLIATLLILAFDTKGQNKIITGKVIDEYLQPVLQAYIQNAHTTFLGKTDMEGRFSISIPIETKSLIIVNVGFESTSINLTDSCNQLDIVLLLSGTYDFISLKKVDKLRMKRFKKLPALHLTAYQRGIFQSDRACYMQSFIPNYHRRKR